MADYLEEEVFAEGLTRNPPAFSRFFEAMAYGHGQLVNYANIARDCGVDAKTVREYDQILVDRAYTELDHAVHFWRTKSGLEVDFVLGDGEVAIAVKGSSRVGARELRPLRVFAEENRPRAAIMVCLEPSRRLADGTLVLPWREFLEMLWDGRVVS